MGEYWHIEDEFKDKTEKYFEKIPEPVIQLSFEIGEKDFVNSGKASAETKMTLKRLGVDSAILRRVAIAAYEAEINVTAHAKGGTMLSNVTEECVHIIFKDKGPGIKDIEQSMTPGFSTADDQVREMGFGAGLGLPNIKKNSDVMHIISGENQQTLLEMIIYFG